MDSSRRILLGFDFSGLAEFLLFVVILLAVLVFVVYKLAAIILPAALIVVVGIAALGVPFLRWEQATVGTRAQRTITAHLDEIRKLERAGLPREQILPLEQRAKEAAQGLADSAFSRFCRVSARNGRDAQRDRSGRQLSDPHAWERRKQQERTLAREMDGLFVTHGVVPDPDPWRRMFHILLQRSWFRWLVDHPRPGGFLITFTFILLVAAVAGVLNEYG